MQLALLILSSLIVLLFYILIGTFKFLTKKNNPQEKEISIPFGISLLTVWLALGSLSALGAYANAYSSSSGLLGPILFAPPAVDAFLPLYLSIFIKPICLIFSLIIIINKPKSASFLLCSNVFLSILIYFSVKFYAIVDSSIFNMPDSFIGPGEIIFSLIFIMYFSTSKKVKHYFSK